MAELLQPVRQRFFDDNGDPLVGGKLYTYAAGTTTPQATYTDYSAGSANTNPVILDANGEADVWIGGLAYKFVLADANDVTQWTVDNVVAASLGGSLSSTYSHGVVDVAALKAVAAADRSEALTIFVESLNAFFYFNPSSSASGDDVLVITPTAGTGRWLRASNITVGSIGSTPSASGASISGQVLTLQPADSTYGGVLTAIAQIIKGAKTFLDDLSCKMGQSTVQSAFTNFALNLYAGNFVNFWDNTSTHFVGISAPASVSSNYDLVLPTAQGAASTVPVNDGSGNLSFSKVVNAMITNSTIDLTTKVTGVLPLANGGTGQATKAPAFDALQPMTTLGDVVYGGASGTGTRLAGDTSNTKKYLSSQASGGVATAPAWAQTAFSDLSGSVASTQMPALTGDVTTSAGAVATTIGANKVTDAMLATMATASFKGRTTAGTGNVEVLSATQATAILNAVVGDSGSGGTKGLVPAPGSGDAAAAKFLKADGTWQIPAGGGGGGGGSILWVEDDESPSSVIENHIRVYQFQAAQATVQLFTVVRIPTSFNSGNPVKVKVPFYSNDTSGTVIMRTQTTLIRNGTDLVTSTTNQRTSTNGTVTMSGPKQNIPQDEVFDVTSSSGQVNGVSVSASDLLIIKLYRDASDTATSDVKVPVYAAEITFS